MATTKITVSVRDLDVFETLVGCMQRALGALRGCEASYEPHIANMARIAREEIEAVIAKADVDIPNAGESAPSVGEPGPG